MKIFVYHNIVKNYCSGDYYFIAVNRPDANSIANHFAANHNVKTNDNNNYIIEWDDKDVKEFEIKPGFLPLNRIILNMEK